MDDVFGVDVSAAAGNLGEQREHQRQARCMGGPVEITIGEDGGQQRTAVAVLLSSAREQTLQAIIPSVIMPQKRVYTNHIPPNLYDIQLPVQEAPPRGLRVPERLHVVGVGGHDVRVVQRRVDGSLAECCHAVGLGMDIGHDLQEGRHP